MLTVWRFCAALATVCLGLAAPAAAAAPASGRYDGEMCVAVGAGPPSCGKAELQLNRDRTASARVSDVVYRLQLRPTNEVAVLLTQGAGQLDAFVADFAWEGNALRFSDVDKGARYELRFLRRR